MTRTPTALLVAAAVALVGAAFVGAGPDERERVAVPSEPTVTARIALAGDLLLGRGVSSQLAADPGAVFEGIRHVVAGADLAAANLESPLTRRPHRVDNPNALEADPADARAVAGAGFDLLAVANNHALDAGAGGLDDTLAALDRAGLGAVGSASEPIVITEAGGIRIAWLAFDATGTTAPDDPGLVAWDDERAPGLIARAAGRADVVIAGVHGGVEYHPLASARMDLIAELMVSAGADVVWGHGAHVVQPVTTAPTPSGDRAVVATSLGNLLFDQSGVARTTGALLEVLVDDRGVVAYRVARLSHPDRVIRFVRWEDPGSRAVFWSGSWWTVVGPIERIPGRSAATDGFRPGDVMAAGAGDVTGDGRPEVVVSFRRPFRPTPLSDLRPDDRWRDAEGRSAHLGVYRPGFDEVWVAGTVVRPVADLVVCDGGLAVTYSDLDDPARMTAGALVWNGFGFDASTDLAEPGDIGCADLDGDGATEPQVSRR